MELARLRIEVIGAEVDIKRVGLFNKETSNKIVTVNYIQMIVNTITEIVYDCPRNRIYLYRQVLL